MFQFKLEHFAALIDIDGEYVIYIMHKYTFFFHHQSRQCSNIDSLAIYSQLKLYIYIYT